ncbi:hypothetical protein [Niabella beijingensis]|uniref:hypothetical protein n=1 Tax=Niabella beijingensis TaxID=2872700 RepID=UPI001CBBF288|nr:hypothetical protein [Niabella beijingensis]MBZ4190261.1 hypothetical protein [Niabella beijingensis]
MKLRQTPKTHFSTCGFILITGILVFLIGICFNADATLWSIFILYYLLTTLPAVYLHILYYLKNKGEAIELKPDQIIVLRSSREQVYTGKDISKIIVCKSANMDNGIPMMAVEYYYYAEIVMNNGENVVITCLMSRKIDAILKGYLNVSFYRDKNVFSLFKWRKSISAVTL